MDGFVAEKRRENRHSLAMNKVFGYCIRMDEPDVSEPNGDGANEPAAKPAANELAAAKASADTKVREFADRSNEIDLSGLTTDNYKAIEAASTNLLENLKSAKSKAVPYTMAQRALNAASAATGFGKKGGFRASTRRRRNRRAGKSRRRRR